MAWSSGYGGGGWNGPPNILMALTMAFNLINIVGLTIFLFYAYRRRDEFALRRFPPMTVLQILCLNSWVNSLLQRSGLHVQMRSQDGRYLNSPYADPLMGFYIISVACPVYITTLALKGLSLTMDFFASKKMFYEATTGKPFDPRKQLTSLERKFFWVQHMATTLRTSGSRYSSAGTKALGKAAGAAGVTPIREDMISDTASTHSSSGGNMARRVRMTLVLQTLCFIVIVSGIMLPIGLWAGSCFEPDVGFTGCRERPYYIRLFIPLFIFNGGYALMLPMLLYMLRDIRDVFYIRNETLLNYLILAFVFVAQLVVELPDLPFPDPLRGFFFQLCVLPFTTLTMVYFPIFCCWHNQRSLDVKKFHVQHNPETFEKILKDKFMMEELKKVLMDSYCLENGLFWTDYSEVVRIHNVPTTTETERANALRKLYKNYVQPGAPRELNLKGGTSAAIIKAAKGNKLTLEPFKHAKDEVFQMMYSNSFPKLIQQVQRNVTTINPSRQSEVSHGVNHTAMGSGIPLREPSGSVAG